MAGINCGILHNAYPLTAEQIAALEQRTLETGEAFVYLDENSKLCFTMPFDPEIIKDLAWHNTYKLTKEDNSLTKAVYKKQSQKSFCLVETLKKNSITDEWISMYLTSSILNEGLLDEFILE